MFCENCGKPAMFQVITVIGDNKQFKKYLCADCISEINNDIKDLMHDSFAIENFLHKILEELFNIKAFQIEENLKDITCDCCGLKYEELIKKGKIGCAKCYRTFFEQIQNILKNVQGKTEHLGKIPKTVGEYVLKKQKIRYLQNLMEDYVKKEKYEEAAKIRDEIKAISALTYKKTEEVNN